MALTGDIIDAATAADWGLINRAVPADELDAVTLDLITARDQGQPALQGDGQAGFSTARSTCPQSRAYDFAIE